jgi:hypothetical protein
MHWHPQLVEYFGSHACAHAFAHLRQVNPDLFAVSVMTVDGQSFNFGDTRERFALQSVAAPISYCLACQEHGSNYVHRYVGREPSGLSGKAIKLKTVPEAEQVSPPPPHTHTHTHTPSTHSRMRHTRTHTRTHAPARALCAYRAHAYIVEKLTCHLTAATTAAAAAARCVSLVRTAQRPSRTTRLLTQVPSCARR